MPERIETPMTVTSGGGDASIFSSAVSLVLFGRSGRGKRDRALSSLRTLSWSSSYLAVFHCPVKDDTNQEVWLNLELATSMAAMGNGVTKVTFAGGNTVGVQEKPTKIINARLVQS